jgi:hypothetical protein
MIRRISAHPSRRWAHVTGLLPLALASLGAAAPLQERWFTPPPRPGYIYVVVRYAGPAAQPVPTNFAVQWGGWRRSSVIPVAQARGGVVPEGLVVRLRHYKPDSVPMRVETDGTILRGPYQGAPPVDWTRPAFRLLYW